MALIITDLKQPLEVADVQLNQIAANYCGVPQRAITALRIVRRSLDARRKNDIHFRVNVRVEIDPNTEKQLLKRGDAHIVQEEQRHPQEPAFGTKSLRGRVVVVGLGPGGLFAAYQLAKYGYRPLVIERGKSMDERVRDVEQYWGGHGLVPDSNVMFGEGGAGTFSDGKLTTRIKDPRSAECLEILEQCGAPSSIGVDAKPHIGTDHLRQVVKNLRQKIEALGGEVRFSTTLSGFETDADGISSVVLNTACGTERIETNAVLLAIGQGARDTYRMLHEKGVAMAPKPFAVGVRVEHPQELINRAQFGTFWDHPRLGAAEYRLTGKSGTRGVYTFCMCPGGLVVASASERGQVVVNGMSNHARDAKNANSAVVVQVFPEDFGPDALDGVRFVEKLEQDAFRLGGGHDLAPAAAYGDFRQHRATKRFSNVEPSYRPGVMGTNLWRCLPAFVAQGVSDGISAFGRQLRGYDMPDAVLTAVESRTSAPLRILRGEDGQSVSHIGLYPIGEGAGYAGGIVSAAVDGMAAAEQVAIRFAPTI